MYIERYFQEWIRCLKVSIKFDETFYLYRLLTNCFIFIEHWQFDDKKKFNGYTKIWNLKLLPSFAILTSFQFHE